MITKELWEEITYCLGIEPTRDYHNYNLKGSMMLLLLPITVVLDILILPIEILLCITIFIGNKIQRKLLKRK